MTGVTPGQAARQQHQHAILDGASDETAWELGAEAAIATAKPRWTERLGPVVACEHPDHAAQQSQPAPADSPQADSRDEALSVARWMLRRIALGQERDPSVGADKALVMIRELLKLTGHDQSEVERNLADQHLARAFTAGAQHAQQPQPAAELGDDL